MDDNALARLALSRLVEPGTWPVHDAVQRYGAVAVWDALRAGRPIGEVTEGTAGGSGVRAERYDVLEDVRQAVMTSKEDYLAGELRNTNMWG